MFNSVAVKNINLRGVGDKREIENPPLRIKGVIFSQLSDSISVNRYFNGKFPT